MAWSERIEGRERQAVGVALAGWILDAMDFMSYALVIPILLAALHMSRGEAGAITSAALMTSAVGGWIGGLLADRFGRIRVLQWVVLWFAAFSVLCGFAETPGQLLVLRALQGFGFGGEWAVGAALVADIVRTENRGKAMSIVQAGWSIGWGAAIALVSLVSLAFKPAMAWHVVMWAGALPALLVFYIWWRLPESPAFLQARREAAQTPAILGIFAPGLRRNTALGCLMTVGLQGGFFAVQTWLPTYLRLDRHFSVGHVGADLAIVILSALAGGLMHGFLSDRIGRRPAFIGYALCAAATVIAYMVVPTTLGLTLMAIPLGFFTSGVYGGVGAILSELFPTLVRASGLGFTYNFGRGFGAVFPALVGGLGAALSLGTAIAIFSSAAYAIAAIAVLLMASARSTAPADSRPAMKEISA